jgi:hypothetical protein
MIFHPQLVSSNIIDTLSLSDGQRDYHAELQQIMKKGIIHDGKAYQPPPRSNAGNEVIQRQRALQQQRKEAALNRLKN